jgi:hypothetical protein
LMPLLQKRALSVIDEILRYDGRELMARNGKVELKVFLARNLQLLFFKIYNGGLSLRPSPLTEIRLRSLVQTIKKAGREAEIA